MTDATIRKHRAARAEWAARFIAEPHKFKVCTQCLSISMAAAGLCLVCGTYRFDCRPERVIEIATIIGSTPFPFTAGTVPRLEESV